MLKIKSNKGKLLSLFLGTIIIFLIITTNTINNDSRKEQPIANKGVLDLRNWDFKKDGIVKLNGDWEFYENELLSPKDFGATLPNKKYSRIPGSYGEQGYGTYRLKLLLKDSKELYSIKIEFLQSAYRLWEDDIEIAEVGKVGRNKVEMTPQLLPKAGTFTDDKGDVYLTLEVSNFYAMYGAVDTIVLGKTSDIDKQNANKLAFDLFLFGSTLIAAVYNMGMFLKRKKDKSTLYFAIVCLIVAIRTLFLGQRFFISNFPNFSYFISGKIMHWSYYLYIPFIVLYINIFYKGILWQKIVKLSNISAYVYGFLVLICPWQYYMDLILPAEITSIFLLSYLIIKLSKVYLKKGGSDFVIIGALFSLLLTRVNDMLYEYSIIITGSYSPIGTLIFIIATSYILAERQSIALSKVEDMSEKLNSLNNLKDEFLAVTSHELKTPLNGIIGLSESLNNDIEGINEEDKHNLYLINMSARRLTNLVDDIMVFSKLKSGDIKLHKKAVNISKVVEIVFKLCEISINNKKIKLVNLFDGNTPYVFADEGRIQQILYNLVGNAIKFTSNGSITISYAAKGNFLEISIEDTGIGIPKDKIANIFNFFEQGDGISEKYGGTGIGLYITKKLVELHNGSINVTSKPNEGSTFIFTLPIINKSDIAKVHNVHGAYEDAYNSLGYKGSSIKEDDDFNGLKTINSNIYSDKVDALIQNTNKILIVDDEYVNLKVLEKYLISDKTKVLNASNGVDALKILENNSDIDLIILDMMMPDLLGYEVCTLVREKYSLFELPILIMTADNRLENLVVAFECGANDYLEKPFKKRELLVRVNTLLTLKHSVLEALNLTREVNLVKEKVKDLSNKNLETSKKVVELMEYDKLKTEFFTNLSHELRTPLNVISSTIQLLNSLDESKSLGEERIKYYFSIINQNSLRLLRLVNNLIDITKIDGGYMNLNLVNDNIVNVVEEIAQSVAEYIHSKEINIIFDTEVEEKYMAFDEEKLERIMLNILSNSVKFTNKGGSIFVNIYDMEDFVEISVRDTGIGIPQDKLDFIFERFAQVDKSLNRRSEGSGIGLSLVKAFVELHGGQISVKSEVGKGTEFVIKFPVIIVNKEEIKHNIGLKEVPESKYEKNLSVEFSDIYM
jgi:two-component system, sensor histidine kinase ChiS